MRDVDLSLLNIIDLEATCWRNQDSEQLPGEKSEIIEIGIAVLNTKELKIEEKRSIVIKPSLSKVGSFCTELTGWTQETVDRMGITIYAARDILKKNFNCKKRVWGSWGDYDRKQVVRDCDNKGCNYFFGDTHINIKNLFALVFKLDKEVSVERACEMADITFVGRLHNGEDDAYNIARLMQIILKKVR